MGDTFLYSVGFPCARSRYQPDLRGTITRRIPLHLFGLSLLLLRYRHTGSLC
jgi:hypothetical protein